MSYRGHLPGVDRLCGYGRARRPAIPKTPIHRPTQIPQIGFLIDCLPAQVTFGRAIELINQWCGIDGDQIPTPETAYSFSEILTALISRGYRRHGVVPFCGYVRGEG